MDRANSDRIEKRIILRAPRFRVWQALAEADEFGQWFGVKLASPFVAGQSVTGQVTHPGFEHIPFNLTVERMEPGQLLAWRWHVLIDPEGGRVSEPTTLVEFHLEDADGGTLLTVVESGFDNMPPEYRDRAYRGNEGGWSQQMLSIESYLAEAA
ncbi:MAG: SRPBCC family protein [Chloroflexota bacterium]